ncbi:flavin reductase [Micromonospora sp. WMMD998]|uniref:flavin reductase n=1 Tax=Micromonospora sp. WMMD998 TaxID=3016092 RepID=UPI00249C215C|nr:flavin reductase [Micromonospora sp. WMMD998]WFE41972.1 flavin reductase [Micromonospora sp. WMMD998]
MTARPARAARALDVLDERMSGVAHQPHRPSWECACCGEPWPCPAGQTQLAEAYRTDRSGLSIYMAGLYAAAVDEMPTYPASVLYARFVSWTRALRAAM